MRAYAFSGWLCRFLALLLIPAVSSAGVPAEDEEAGWSPGHMPPAEPWREQASELPDYPVQNRLVEISVQTGNYPYDVFIDTGSLEVGGDGVVRYVVVIRSRAGAENIAFEGIHCRERTFRRYAYGINNAWQPVTGGDWQALKTGGMGHYRFVLYRDYVCDPSNPGMKESEMIQRMRYSRGAVLDD
jgi:hypothetical protein